MNNPGKRLKILPWWQAWVVILCWGALAWAPAWAGDDLSTAAGNAISGVVEVLAFNQNGSLLAKGFGFFVGDGGEVVACRHVLEGAFRVEVKTAGGMTYAITQVVGDDDQRDLIRVSVDIPPGQARALPLSSHLPAVGEHIVVVGGGSGSKTAVTMGTVTEFSELPGAARVFLIDAPLPPDSPGSPVINARGEVVGIAQIQVVDGLKRNFAFPAGWVTLMTLGPRQTLAEWKQETGAEGPHSPRGDKQSGWRYLLAGDYKEALPYFESAIKGDPGLVEAYYGEAYCLYQLGRKQESVPAFRQALKLKPDYSEAHYNLGVALDDLGHKEEAIKEYQEAIRITPRVEIIYLSLGLAYVDLGRFEEGINAYKQALAIWPDYAEAYVDLGLAYEGCGRTDEAIQAIQKAIQIAPDLAEAQYNLGVIYDHHQRLDEALEAYRQAILIKPDHAQAYYSLGVIQGNRGHWKEALQAFQQVIRFDPGYVYAHYNLGVAFSKLKRWNEAIQAYQADIRLDPTHEKVHFALGMAYLELSRWSEAARAFQEAIRLKPDFTRAHYHLGFTYLNLGDWTSARREYEALKKLDAATAAELLESIQNREGAQ